MKFIRFTLSKGDPFILPFLQAERLLDGEGQLVKITNDAGEWTGQTINKAHIVCTDRDTEEEAKWKDRNIKRLPEPEKQSDPKRVEQLRKEINQRFGRKN
jgi:hypothetical protein